MFSLMQKKPILHVLAWIGLYIVMVNIGDAITESTGFAYASAVLVLALSALLVIYLLRHGQAKAVGLKPVGSEDLRRSLYYLPLALLVILQLATGIDPTLGVAQLVGIVALMVGVGLIEEILFRGLLYQAIEQGSGVQRAIVISGITFGLGHIVNLLRGFESQALIGQIVAAVAIGIVLALLVALTGSIVPGIVFHVLFNISGSITSSPENDNLQLLLLAGILVVCLLYGIYLVRLLQRDQATPLPSSELRGV